MAVLLALILSAVLFLMAKASQADAGREEIKAFLDKMTYRPLGNVGTVDRAPWNGLSEKDVDHAIDAIRKEIVL